VDIWDDWIVFPPDFTAELRQRLDGAVKETEERKQAEPTETGPKESEAFASRFKASTFQLATTPAVPETAPDDVDGEAMDLSSDEDQTSKDLDGIPVDDLDGEPVDDVDGDSVDDMDGESIQDDLDGAPIDEEDLDGMPIDDLDGKPVDT